MNSKCEPTYVVAFNKNYNGEISLCNDYVNIDKILLHKRVVNRKIVILGVVGEYRKGKSFFLNCCLRFMYNNYASLYVDEPSRTDDWIYNGETLEGFHWQHGSKADTKGILFWPDVFLHDTPKDKIAIILADTQGLFETNSTMEENSKIFALSTLISSIQIVNLKDVMQENQIENLEMATSMAKLLTKIQLERGDTQILKPFQKLTFLIRDWADYDIGFGYEGGEKYLTEFLDTPSQTENKSSEIRKAIRQSFDDIKCFLLNYPGTLINKKEFRGNLLQLDYGFVGNLIILIESLLSPENLTKKSVLGRDITCGEYRDFIISSLQTFELAKLPDPKMILQLQIENQLKSITNGYIRMYHSLMTTNVNYNSIEFEKCLEKNHERKKAHLIDRFSKTKTIADYKSFEKYKRELDQEIEYEYHDIREQLLRNYKIHLCQCSIKVGFSVAGVAIGAAGFLPVIL